MVTVTMAARQQRWARPLRHGTVVLFNIWLRMSTACFYHIIQSQPAKTSPACGPPDPPCADRTNAAQLLLCFGLIAQQQQGIKKKKKTLAENSLPSEQSHIICPLTASHGTRADAFFFLFFQRFRGICILLRKWFVFSKSGQKNPKKP